MHFLKMVHIHEEDRTFEWISWSIYQLQSDILHTTRHKLIIVAWGVLYDIPHLKYLPPLTLNLTYHHYILSLHLLFDLKNHSYITFHQVITVYVVSIHVTLIFLSYHNVSMNICEFEVEASTLCWHTTTFHKAQHHTLKTITCL